MLPNSKRPNHIPGTYFGVDANADQVRLKSMRGMAERDETARRLKLPAEVRFESAERAWQYVVERAEKRLRDAEDEARRAKMKLARARQKLGEVCA